MRDTAQRLLLVRSGDHMVALARVASGEDTIAALHAIWALQGRDELQRELVIQIAVSGDLQRQIQVLRAGHSLLSAADLVALHEALQDAPDALAMQLAFAMGGHAGDAAVRADLVQLLIREQASPYVHQAVVRAVAGEELIFLREYLASVQSYVASEECTAVLVALANSAYRSLRGDISSGEPANPALLELLALVKSRDDEDTRQQIAMLKGMESVVASSDFVPAQLERPPPIFADSTVSDQDPLWQARLAGRTAFAWPGDELALGITPLGTEQLRLMALGEAFYSQCAACHATLRTPA